MTRISDNQTFERRQEANDRHSELYRGTEAEARDIEREKSDPYPSWDWAIIDGYYIERVGTSPVFEVKTPEHRIYLVDTEAGTCECADFLYRGEERPCKHIRMLWRPVRDERKRRKAA